MRLLLAIRQFRCRALTLNGGRVDAVPAPLGRPSMMMGGCSSAARARPTVVLADHLKTLEVVVVKRLSRLVEDIAEVGRGVMGKVRQTDPL